MMVYDGFLLGGAITILKNDGVRQWENDCPIIPYMKWKIQNSCLKPPTRTSASAKKEEK